MLWLIALNQDAGAITPAPGTYRSPQGLEQISVTIADRDWRKLADERDAWRKRGLPPEDRTSVRATIGYGAASHPAAIRLKGTGVDHADPRTPSLHISMENGREIRGLSVFSIQAPARRLDQLEPLFHEGLDRLGLTAIRYELVHVRVNGEDWGIMALEESPGLDLLERTAEKKGLLFAFDKSPRRRVQRATPRDEWRSDDALYLRNDWQARPIEIVACMADDCGKEERIVRGLVSGLARGELNPSEVFDVDRTGLFLAAVDLFDAKHCLSVADLRMLYSPATRRIRFVAFDGYLQTKEAEILAPGVQNSLVGFLLEDPAMFHSYRTHLAKLSSPEHVPDFLAWLKSRENDLLAVLGLTERPRKRFDRDRFHERLDLMRRSPTLHDEAPKVAAPRPESILRLETRMPLPLVARAETTCENGARYTFTVANLLPLQIILHELRVLHGGKETVHTLREALPARDYRRLRRDFTVSFPGRCPTSASLRVSVAGGTRTYTIEPERVERAENAVVVPVESDGSQTGRGISNKKNAP